MQHALPMGLATEQRWGLRDVTLSHISLFMATMFTLIRMRLDTAGIVLSGLCAAHCFATIFIISALGLGSETFFPPALHEVGLVLAVIIAAVAIGWGTIQHRRAAPFMVAMTGLIFMAGALTVPHGPNEAMLTVVGVALVSLGHFLNLRPQQSQQVA